MKKFFSIVRQLLKTAVDHLYAAYAGDPAGIYHDGWRRYDPDDTI
ncbi:hypothetical protein [Alistipes sp.]